MLTPKEMAEKMKSVFIAYSHNPEEYKYLLPPDTYDPQILESFELDQQRNEQKQKEDIRQQKKLVHEFANFLIKKHVKVSYDQQLDDTGCGNIMKWYEEQMRESDYVIIIATQSLCDFLKDPPKEEMLFAGEFFDNFIRYNSRKILSVFLDRVKDSELLPIGLISGNLYEILSPFSLEDQSNQSDMVRLYALLSDQNRFEPPAPDAAGPVKLKPRGRFNRVAGGAGGAPQAGGHAWHSVFERLSRIEAYLTDAQIFSIADKAKFHARWRTLAPLLELTRAQIEICEVNSGGYGDREKCLQMLKTWKNAGLYGPPGKISVARLTNIVYRDLRNMEMLEVLGECVK